MESRTVPVISDRLSAQTLLSSELCSVRLLPWCDWWAPAAVPPNIKWGDGRDLRLFCTELLSLSTDHLKNSTCLYSHCFPYSLGTLTQDRRLFTLQEQEEIFHTNFINFISLAPNSLNLKSAYYNIQTKLWKIAYIIEFQKLSHADICFCEFDHSESSCVITVCVFIFNL